MGSIQCHQIFGKANHSYHFLGRLRYWAVALLFGLLMMGASAADAASQAQLMNAPGMGPSAQAAICPPSIGFGETIQCSIDASGEQDSYSFSGSAGDKVLVRMAKSSGNIWPGLTIYGPDATSLCSGSSTSTAEIASCSLPTSGTYSIQAYDSFNGTFTGDYSLYLQLNNPGSILTNPRITTANVTLLARQAILPDTSVTGDLTGTLGLTGFETVLFTDGPYTGKGFVKGEYQAVLGGVPYSGAWQGTLNFMAEGNKFTLNGSTSGGISAVIEGFISESVPGSGAYDHYQATWKAGKLGDAITSATLEIIGNLTLQGETEYLNTPLRILQAGMDGAIYGDYPASVSLVITLLSVAGGTSPYQGEGLSYMSYSADPGTGNGWSYATSTLPGETTLAGMLEAPYFGILQGDLNENRSPATLRLTISRVDLGLVPAADLKINVIGAGRISPGQTVNYIIQYNNSGLKAADDALVLALIYAPAEFAQATPGWEYDDYFHSLSWDVGTIPAGGSGSINVQVHIPWGLAEGTQMGVSAHIVNAGPPPAALEGATEPANLFVNGINYQPDTVMSKKYSEFSKLMNAAWTPIYDKGMIYDAMDVADASPYSMLSDEVVASDNNGLTNPQIINHEYDTCYGYSGGTRTIVTAIRLYHLVCHKVVLISPMSGWQLPGTYTNELKDLHQNFGVEKIDIYQAYNDQLPLGSFYQAYYYPDEPWLAPNNVTIHEVPVGVKQSIEAHLELFWKVNEQFVGREASEAIRNSAISTARDPNAKSVSPEFAEPGDTLDFTVEFENEGEGTAYGVYVVDRLDDHLDDSTLTFPTELPALVDSYTYHPEDRTIVWYIDEVGPGEGSQLPYSIAVKNDSPPDYVVTNFATVYFPSVPEETNTNVVTVSENRPPTVISITCADPNPTNATEVGFTVQFSEPVFGVDSSAPFDDFVLTVSGITGASITGVSGTGITYTVSVNTGSGNGTIRLDVASAATITDPEGKPLDGLPFTSGQSYITQKLNILFLPIIMR
jgi:uncharacterized repeat protein (TIGR01451 family)